MAETSGGIYAKGIVTETSSVKEFSTVEEVLSFSNNFNDDSYWISKIRDFSDKLTIDPNYKLRFHEYFIEDGIKNLKGEKRKELIGYIVRNFTKNESEIIIKNLNKSYCHWVPKNN